MSSNERISERAALLKLRGDEAPMRFTLIGAVVAGAIGAVYDRDAPLWVMAVSGAAGGVVGWLFGTWRRAQLRKQERHVLSMLDRVERNEK